MSSDVGPDVWTGINSVVDTRADFTSKVTEFSWRCKSFLALIDKAYWHDEEAVSQLKDSEQQITDLIEEVTLFLSQEREKDTGVDFLGEFLDLEEASQYLYERNNASFARFVPFVKLDGFDKENSDLVETKLEICGPKTISMLSAVEDDVPIKLFSGDVLIKRNGKWFRLIHKSVHKPLRTREEMMAMVDVANGQNVRIAETRVQGKLEKDYFQF